MSLTKIDPQVRRMVLDLAQDPHDPRKYKCAGCGRKFSLNAVNIDHMVPESESFPDARSDPDNLQVLCNPKGSTRLTSCHKKKSALEARDRARRNRIPIDWTGVIGNGSLACMAGGYTLLSLMPGPVTPEQWLPLSAAGIGLTLGTILVQNAWSQRSPREVIPSEPKPEPEPQPSLDTNRIIEAVREVVGKAGSVEIIDLDEMNAFTVIYAGTGFADHDGEKRFELLEKIQAKMGDRWMPVWDTTTDRVRFTRRPALPRMVRHPGFTTSRPWNVLPVAEGVSFDLLITPHLLIVGTTGAGKTALMRTLIVAVADSAHRTEDTELILADPKYIEMPGFEGWSGVRKILSEDQDLWNMAFDLEEEMRDRMRLVKAKKAKPSDFKRLILVIDEYEQYFKRMDRYWKTGFDEEGKPLKKGSAKVPPPIDAIQSVLSMVRRLNMNIIIGTQSPDSNWFGGTGTRENMSGRAAVGPVDQYRARMMFDDSGVGREVPIEFKGRTTIQVGNGQPEEIQVYYTPDPFDPDQENTAVDWKCLLSLGMPAMHLPEAFHHLLKDTK